MHCDALKSNNFVTFIPFPSDTLAKTAGSVRCSSFY